MSLLPSHRDALLRLLWAPQEKLLPECFEPLMHSEGIAIARQNTVLLRSASRMRQLELPLSPEYHQAELLESARVANLLELVARVADICRQIGVRFMFAKAFQHLPDMGHDVDLLLIDSSPAAISTIASALKAQPGPDSFCQRLAHKKAFIVPGYHGPLEVQQGRLGHVGEHEILPELVWSRRCNAFEVGVPVSVPSREDALMIQVVQRIFGHRHLRLSDMLRTASLLNEPIDWKYMQETSKRIGIITALSDYLSVVERAHHTVTGRSLMRAMLSIPVSRGQDIRLSSDGRLATKIVLRAYRDKFMTDLMHGDWNPVTRLCLLPIVALTVKLHWGSRQ